MLFGFAVLAVVTTALVEALGVELAPTAFLNFVLYLAWNITAVLGFIRYLTHPVDVFAEQGVPPAALDRYGISPREADVILQLSRGLSNKEIAERLNVSFTTVRTHVYNVFKKTGAASRVELLRILSGG
jgi:DNA-binding CsgD family transcriptional regulator